MREVEVGGRAHRCRPDRLHHALGVRGDLRRGRHHARRPCHAAPRRRPGAPRLERRDAARPVRRHRPLGRRHRRLRRRRRGAAATAVSARDARRISRRWKARSSAPRSRSLTGLVGGVGLRGSAICGRSSRSTTLWQRARRLFPRSAPAPAVRPLRHLLRLVAVPGAGDADAGGPCRAGGRLAGRGRHASAGGGAGRAGAPSSGASFRYGTRGARDHRRARPGRPACGLPTASASTADAVVVNADVAALAAGPARRAVARAVPADAAPRAVAVGRDLGACVARGRGLPAAAPQRVLLARLCGRVRRHLPATGACRRDPPSMSAPRTATTATRPRRNGPERLLCLSTRRPRRHPSLRCRGDRAMRDADLRPAGALRPARCAAIRSDGGDDAGGLRPAVPGDGRSALRPGVARLEGVVRAPGGAEPDAGPLSGGGQHASGAGRADGGASGRMAAASLLADLASTSRSPRTAMPGGTSTR